MVEPNPSVDVSYRDAVCTITLNRPQRYNAITVPMMERLTAALREAEADERIRCVVLTATGPGFCAGQDLHVLAQFQAHHDPAEIGELLRNHYNQVVAAIQSLDLPVIAAVQGVAAGAGWSLVLACDLRIAAASARFVPGFAKLGLVPDLGGSATLVEAVGYARAMEFALVCSEMSAREALGFDLLNRIVPDEELMPTALEWAGRIAILPPAGVRLTKRALRNTPAASFDAHLAREACLQSVAAGTPGHTDRVREFATRKS